MTDVAPADSPCVWLRLDRPVPRPVAVGMARALEVAVRARFELLVAGGNPAAVPVALRPVGRTDGDGPFAQWLPLPDGPGPEAGIGGACIRLPAGTAGHVVVGVAVAAGALGELTVPGPGITTRVRLFDGAAEPAWTHPSRWQGPARRFRTVFPIVHDLVGGDPTDAVVRRWCRQVGLPDPVVTTVRAVDIPAGLDVDLPDGTGPDGMATPGGMAAPDGTAGPSRAACQVELRFDTAVSGPFAIGPARHHGPGLMVPDRP